MRVYSSVAVLLMLLAAIPALAAKDENYSAAVRLIKSKNYDENRNNYIQKNIGREDHGHKHGDSACRCPGSSGDISDIKPS